MTHKPFSEEELRQVRSYVDQQGTIPGTVMQVVGRLLATHDEADKQLRMYEGRFDYIYDNSLIYGTGNGQQVHFSVPVCHEDLGCAIDEAIKNNLTSPPAIKPWPIKLCKTT